MTRGLYNAFKWAYMLEFHRHFKRELHAMNYGHRQSRKLYEDFVAAYVGGGEL